MHLMQRAYLTRQWSITIQQRLQHTSYPQSPSPKPSSPPPTLDNSADLTTFLSNPSWSTKSLFPFPSQTTPASSNITRKQLHHLLRLSALPLPSSQAEEANMMADLKSQLQFVRAIQEVDTEGVEPLRAIRDETRDAELEGEIGMEELKGEFEKEEIVGNRGRIRRRVEEGVNAAEEVAEGRWDPLGQAPKKIGRFIVVETGKG